MHTKQVIVLRKDLGMRKGKMIAQGAHASMAGAVLNRAYVENTKVEGFEPKAYLIMPDLNEYDLDWIQGKFTKVVVSVDSEEELLDIHKQAMEKNITCSLIRDAGLTEFKGVPTYTAVAIGPWDSEEIDKITGNLKLL